MKGFCRCSSIRASNNYTQQIFGLSTTYIHIYFIYLFSQLIHHNSLKMFFHSIEIILVPPNIPFPFQSIQCSVCACNPNTHFKGFGVCRLARPQLGDQTRQQTPYLCNISETATATSGCLTILTQFCLYLFFVSFSCFPHSCRSHKQVFFFARADEKNG